MAKITEIVEGDNQEKKIESEQAEDVKLLGMKKDYVLGGGLTLVLFSIMTVWFMVEDREQRNMYLQMGFYNMACVLITYFMT